MLHMWSRLIVLMCSVVVGNTEDYCYVDVKNPYLEFGNTTAYEHVYNREGIPEVEGCRPVQLWLLSRHGTRYPLQDELQPLTELAHIRDAVLLNYDANKTQLCAQDVDNLRNWTFNVTTQEAGLLTTQGKDDLYTFARRLTDYFPELLNTSYSPEKFIIRHSNTTRTKESAQYFAKGLFGSNLNETTINITNDDHFLHSNHYCPKWQDGQWFDESNRWDQGEEMTAMLNEVSRRLGFDHNLPLQNVTTMYDMCRYQKAWFFYSLSPWCAVFSEDNLKVLEYRVDLQEYYYIGPGNDYGERLACPLIKDMVDRFTKVEMDPGTSNPVAVLYFSHDILLSMVISRMGLVSDSIPLRADNYHEQQNRHFLTSRFVHFATNLLAVLYNCSGELKVALYHAEYPLQAFGCQQIPCDWTYLKTYFGPIVNNSLCTDTSFCSGKASSYTFSFYYHIIFILFLLHTFNFFYNKQIWV